ncbi:class I SAM-dependent methyltransferase [Chloroflexota bacterium]
MYSQDINRVKASEVASTTIYDHFTSICDRYRHLRTTDYDPIAYIARELSGLDIVEAADVGCGDGRYDLPLFHHLGDKLRLSCVDSNDGMLEASDTYLRENNISNFVTVNSGAEILPFPDGTLDCVLTMNAVHHFNLPNFLLKSARTLKSDGYLFIYTRLREQNKRHIWGLHFPNFHQKERRLYNLNTFMQFVEAAPAIWVESIRFFKYRRVATIEKLIELARARHYSTFVLYSSAELEKAITSFVKNLERNFKDTQQVAWFDEYALLTIRKDERRQA